MKQYCNGSAYDGDASIVVDSLYTLYYTDIKISVLSIGFRIIKTI